MPYNKLKKLSIFCFKAILAVLIVWYLYKSGRFTEEIFSKIFTIKKLPYIILCGIAFLISQFIAAARLNLLLKTINLPLTFLHVFKLTMIGNFFNIVIPGAVGGDVIKGAYLYKNEADRRGRSTGIVLIDRIIGFLALCTIGVLSIIYLYPKLKNDLALYGYVITLIFILSAVLLFIFLLLVIFGGKAHIRAKLQTLVSALFKKTIFYHMIDAVGAITKRRRVPVYTFMMSIALHLTTISGLMLLVNLQTGSFSSFIDLASASSVVMLFSIVPVTPGNIGWTELIASFGWAAVGSSSGAAVFFYWRVVVILFSLPGAILYFSPQNRVIHVKESI